MLLRRVEQSRAGQSRVEWSTVDSRREEKKGAFASCVAILIVFCKSLLADRIGTATSRMRFECEDLHETLCVSGDLRFR